MRTFLERPIEGLPRRVGERGPKPAPTGQGPYLWIDATYVKVREAGRIVSVAVTIAVALNSAGRREVRGMAFGASEAETFWLEFLRRPKRRGRAGVRLVIYQAYVPGKLDYGAEIGELRGADIAVAFIGGYVTEIGLMARQAHDHGCPVQLIGGASLTAEQFRLIGGPAAEGVVFVAAADPRTRAEAAPVVARFRASGFEPEGFTLYAYAAVQVWAQAAEKAGSLELPAMIASLRKHQFDTVLGPLDPDEKGDVTVQNPVWYVWRDGTYVPLEPSP